MRCPKCHYLSFEPESRCRNCGYEFAFAEEDLLMKSGDEPEGPLTDIPLRPAATEGSKTPITLGPIRPANVRPKEVPQPSASAVGLEDHPSEKDPVAPRREVARRSAPLPPPSAERAATAHVRRPVPMPVRPPEPVVQVARPRPAPVAAIEKSVPPVVASPPAVAPPRPVGKAAPISVELPLFVQRPHTAAQETEAPVVPPAPPPLSVRRRTPDAARIQATYQRETAPAPSPAVAVSPVPNP